MTPRVRHVQEGDWDALVELEASAYVESGLSEGRPLLESRASPATSFVIEASDAIAGYVLTLPYPRFRYPDLTRPEVRVFRSSNLHLHDVVIGKEFRGTGLATRLLQHVMAQARSHAYDRISLIAVAGSAGFWTAHGYHAHPEVTLPHSYGAAAVYMSRELS